MADEQIDILDNNGKFTGEIRLKSEAHRLGLYHASVHIWLYTTEGQILLQKRVDHKDTFPDLWDISVAGHIGAGEQKKNAAIREIHEELGILVSKNKLEYIKVHIANKQPKPALFDNEFNHIYLSTLEHTISSLKLQKDEVADIKLLSIKDFEKEINDVILQKNYVPHGQAYYEFILKEIKNRLTP